MNRRGAKKVILALVAKLVHEFEVSGMFDTAKNSPSEQELELLDDAKGEVVGELMRRSGVKELPATPQEVLALVRAG